LRTCRALHALYASMLYTVNYLAEIARGSESDIHLADLDTTKVVALSNKNGEMLAIYAISRKRGHTLLASAIDIGVYNPELHGITIVSAAMHITDTGKIIYDVPPLQWFKDLYQATLNRDHNKINTILKDIETLLQTKLRNET